MRCLFEKIITCLIVIAASGCRAQRPEISILDNLTCEPPCWQNITPGVTSRKEFLDFTEEYEYIVADSVHDYDAPWQGFDNLIRGRLKFDSETITYFDAFLLNDIIVGMSFRGDWSITLDEVISKFGEPTSVIVIYYGGDFFVNLLIPADGLAFGYGTIGMTSSSKLRIQPDTPINSIDYFAPESYRKILDSGILSYGLLESNDDISRSMYSWNGYGNVEELYPPQFP